MLGDTMNRGQNKTRWHVGHWELYCTRQLRLFLQQNYYDNFYIIYLCIFSMAIMQHLNFCFDISIGLFYCPYPDCFISRAWLCRFRKFRIDVNHEKFNKVFFPLRQIYEKCKSRHVINDMTIFRKCKTANTL